MSKINQIQQAILELDGGEFQKLADAYLAGMGGGASILLALSSLRTR